MSDIKAIRFTGSGASCDEILALIDGPDPAKCMWKSCTYDGGYIKTPDGFVEFCRDDWIIRDVDGSLRVATEARHGLTRKAGLFRVLLIAWLAEEITEGRMVELTGLDRLLLRTIRDELVARGLAVEKGDASHA